MTPEKVNLVDKLSLFSETWTPKIIGNMDDYDLRLAKLIGDFVWHAHADEDELFLIITGRLRMDIRVPDEGERQVWLEEGEMIVIPKGVEHKPFAENECSVLVIEKSSVDHTGGVDDPRRVEAPDRI